MDKKKLYFYASTNTDQTSVILLSFVKDKRMIDRFIEQQREEKAMIGRKMEKKLIKIYKSCTSFLFTHIDSLRECFYFMLVFYFESVIIFTLHRIRQAGIRRENDCEFRCRMFIIVSEIFRT